MFADVKGEIGKLSQEFQRVQADVGVAQAEHDAAVQEKAVAEREIRSARETVAALRQEEGDTRSKLEALQHELLANSELLTLVRELGAMSFSVDGLRQLRDTVVETGTRQELKPKEAVGRFFADLGDYDSMVGFQREIGRLKAVVETCKLEAEKRRAEREAEERKHRDVREAVAATESLLRRGLKADQIVAWTRALAKVGGVEELEADLGRYGSLKDAAGDLKKQAEAVSLTVKRLNGEFTSMKERKAELEGEIQALSAHGAKAIDAARDKAVSALTAAVGAFRDEATKLGELKAEQGRLEMELEYARYLAGGEADFRDAPKIVAERLLGCVVRYYREKGINPKVPVPDFINREYTILAYGDLSLVDLLRWAQDGLAAYGGDRKQWVQRTW